jgi:outer membrane protein insertion porin family
MSPARRSSLTLQPPGRLVAGLAAVIGVSLGGGFAGWDGLGHGLAAAEAPLGPPVVQALPEVPLIARPVDEQEPVEVDDNPNVDMVVEVEIQGAKRVHPNRVLGLLRTQPGRPLRDFNLGEDVRYLERIGPFTSTTKILEQVGERRWKVIFRVIELPLVADVEFTGAGWWFTSGLEKKIRTGQGAYVNKNLLDTDRQLLIEHFRRKNYLNAKVEYRIVEDQFGMATVVFELDVGFQVKVGAVHFENLPSGLGPRVLARKMFGAPAAGLPPLLMNRPSALYFPDMLPVDRNQVTRTVRDYGWLDAVVTKQDYYFSDWVAADDPRGRIGPRAAYDNQRNDRAVITYTIQGGERYRLKEVQFIGNTVISSEQLRRAFAMPDGAWFEREEIDRWKREALLLLQDRGYAAARFVEDRVIDFENREVTLVLDLVEGPKYRLGRVDVEGNLQTKDAVLRREMKRRPLELWNQTDANTSRRNMLRSQVFDQVELQPQLKDSRPTEDPETREADVRIKVKEAQTGSFRVNLGFNSDSGLVGSVTFQEQNFDMLRLVTFNGWRGAGQDLLASASSTSDETTFNIQWSNPRMWDTIYSSRVGFRRTASSQLEWEQRTLQPSIALGRRFWDGDLSVHLGYKYKDIKVSDVEDDAPNDAEAGKYYTNRVGLDQLYSRLNNFRLPSEGFRLRMEQAVVGEWLSSSTDYLDLNGKIDGWIPLYESELGGSIFLHISQLLEWRTPFGNEDIPFYERIYGGGPFPAHRGFERFDLGPRGINDGGFEVNNGGNKQALTTIELSLPIQGTAEGIRLVGFTDIGNVWARGEDMSFDDLYYAAGVGIRFPVTLPIALDFAWLLNPDPGQDNFQLHFNLAGISF